jgi:hypothetical protein
MSDYWVPDVKIDLLPFIVGLPSAGAVELTKRVAQAMRDSHRKGAEQFRDRLIAHFENALRTIDDRRDGGLARMVSEETIRALRRMPLE